MNRELFRADVAKGYATAGVYPIRNAFYYHDGGCCAYGAAGLAVLGHKDGPPAPTGEPYAHSYRRWALWAMERYGMKSHEAAAIANGFDGKTFHEYDYEESAREEARAAHGFGEELAREYIDCAAG